MSELSQAKVMESAPPDCAVCERSLLVGEALQLFRDGSRGLIKVCELCRERALQRGYEQLGFDAAPRLRVQPGGSVRDIVDRDALIEGLGHELAYLKQQLGTAEAALVDHSLQGQALTAITDKLRRQEREVARMRQEHNPAQRAEQQRLIGRQSKQIAELQSQLRGRDEQLARLQAARIAETDPNTVCRFALDAYNASEHADRMARIARTLGEPIVTVDDLGPGIPRHVRITLVWDIAWYSYLVKLDLGAGRASVHDMDNGGDAAKVPAEQQRGNGQWRSSGLVLVGV